MSVAFGITSTGGYGILQSVTKSSSAEVAEVRDEEGKVVQQTAYSKSTDVDFEGVLDGDTLAEVGTSLTVGSTTGLLMSLEVSESNTDFQKVKGKINIKDTATQTAYA